MKTKFSLFKRAKMSFLREGAWHDVDRGGVVFMPKNSVHTFKNIGDTPSRVLIGTSRQGFEKFLKRCAEEFATPGGSDPKRIEAFALKTASTSWRPCRLVLAGQLVCSAKLSDQILWKDFEPIKANRPVSMAPVGSCSADSRRFRRPDFSGSRGGRTLFRHRLFLEAPNRWSMRR